MKRFFGQRGSITILTIFAFGVALASFAALGLGQMMWQKREIQKIADIAARTAASQLGDQSSDFPQARSIAVTNGLKATDKLTFGCITGAGNTAGACSTTSPDAVQATVVRSITPFFFGASKTLVASGTAENSPIIVASLTTGLLTLNSSQSQLLDGLLSGLTGQPVQLCVIGGCGILTTNVAVSILQLQTALGVGSPQELANLKVGLGTLLDTNTSLANNPPDSNTQAASPALPPLNLSVKNLLNQVQVPLGSLLNLDLTQADAALAFVNLGDLSIAGVLGSLQGRSIDLKLTNLPAGVSVKVYVVEQPRLLVARQRRGVRPVGFLRGAQVRVEMNFAQSITGLLGGLNLGSLVSVSVLKGGIYAQVGGAEVTVNQLVCKLPRTQSETQFSGRNGLVKVCLSNRPSNFADTSNTPIICDGRAEVLSLNVASLVQPRVTAGAVIDVASNPFSNRVLGKDPPPFPIPNSTGQALNSLLKSKLDLRLEDTSPSSPLNLLTSLVVQPLLNTITSGLLPIVSQALGPIIDSLGSLVDGLLTIPGIGLNDAQFDVQRLDCSATRLIQ